MEAIVTNPPLNDAQLFVLKTFTKILSSEK